MEIRTALEAAGGAVTVMLQIGTRNPQNFELRKVAGQQRDFPVLSQRGMGIALEEALNAGEYMPARATRRSSSASAA